MLLDLTLATSTEPTFDPANFWVAVVTAVGLYTLTAFPLWDHVGVAIREGRETSFWILLAAFIGTAFPIAGILMALNQLAMDPVPDPAQGNSWIIPVLLGISFIIRCAIPIFLGRTNSLETPLGSEETAEATALRPSPSTPVATATPTPLPPRRRRGWMPWVTGAAGLAAGALLSRRRH